MLCSVIFLRISCIGQFFPVTFTAAHASNLGRVLEGDDPSQAPLQLPCEFP